MIALEVTFMTNKDGVYGDRFFWIDIETTGLNPDADLLLEVGIRITDSELDLIDEKDWQLWNTPHYDQVCGENFTNLDEFILNMHTKSGLLEDACSVGMVPAAAEAEIVEWLTGHGVEKSDPMCGSSVQFDRSWLAEWMPSVHKKFSHRNIDISTVKELCRRLNPELYSKLEQHAPKRELHRALPDLQDTITEARFYVDNFLHVDL